MEVKSIKAWEQNERQVGQAVNWKVVCSSMGPPGAECQSWIRYGSGIDKTQELVILGQETGLIAKAGSWLTCEFMVSHLDVIKTLNPDLDTEDTEEVLRAVKFQGQEKLYNFLIANPEICGILEREINLML